jgi:hypothetical protein
MELPICAGWTAAAVPFSHHCRTGSGGCQSKNASAVRVQSMVRKRPRRQSFQLDGRRL